jgi:hypothetical protein
MSITDEEIMLEAKACDSRKLAQAMRMTPAERFFAGAELFEQACEITLAGIRAQYPDRSDEFHVTELNRLLKLSSQRLAS